MSNLHEIITAINKDLGAGITALSAEPDQVPAIPTGSLSLDRALGIGGLPRGRITEIYGPESCGKSTLALHVIAQAQREGGTAVYFDAEHAFDPGFAEEIGVKLPDLYVSQPDTGEQALEAVERLVEKAAGQIDVIVVDSVAALVPRAELEGQMGESLPGLQARMMSQAMRKLTAHVHRSGAVLIFINQLREKIGVIFGNPETTPGGRALKFYASVRLDMRRKETLKQDGEVIGSRVRVRVVKNKVAPPFREAEFDLLFTGEHKGIDWAGEVLDMGLALVRKGSFYYDLVDGAQVAQGREAAKDWIREEWRQAQKKAEPPPEEDDSADGGVSSPAGNATP